MARGHDPNLDVLRDTYTALARASSDSLQAAYAFGQIVDALSTMYTYEELGAAVGRTYSTVYTYARLYRKYPNVQGLIHMATEMGTYDVSRLCGNQASTRAKYVMQCEHCHSFDVRRKAETEEIRAAKEAELAAVAAAENQRELEQANA